jgi:hypothetical protein
MVDRAGDHNEGKVVKSAVDFSGPTMANQKPKADLTPLFNFSVCDKIKTHPLYTAANLFQDGFRL